MTRWWNSPAGSNRTSATSSADSGLSCSSTMYRSWSWTAPPGHLPVFRHQYQAVRFLPRVPGSLTLEAVLEPAETAPYFTGVRELMSWQEAGHLAADGY
ncbi:hypothetical protein ACWGA0_04465 [Streptomyces erythrochromogenes]